MGTPIAFMSGTTNGFSVGATKRATIGLNTGTSLVSGNNWWNGVDVGSQYLLYSDQFSQGQSVIPTSRPTAWSTPSITDQNLLNLINTLPDRVGLTPFVNINVALQWLQNSQKYLLLKNGYENIVTDGLVLNLDAGWYNSYPGNTNSIASSWTDYNNKQAYYTPISNNGVILYSTSSDWVGYFPATVNSAGLYTLEFDYVTNDAGTLVLDNDGIVDNEWNASIANTTTQQKYKVTRYIGTTGNINFFLRRSNGGNHTITNFSFTNANTWFDLSGQGNNATLVNGVTFSTTNGAGALVFDGVDDYAFIPDNTSLDIVNDKTYGIWIYLNQDPGSGGFVGKADSTYRGMALAYGWGGNGFQNIAWNAANSPYLSPSASDFSNWYYIVGLQSGDVRYIYVYGANGIRSSSFTGRYDSWDNPLNFTIGMVAGYYEYITVGAVQVYNRALSPTEIQQNYDAQKSRFGLWGQTLWSGYTQYYDFSKGQSYIGSGAAMNDLSGIGYNGSVLGGSFATVDGVKCWNCSTNGRIQTDTDFTFGNDYTILIWARALSDSQVSTWRTLLRTTPNDHPLIIADGSDLIGYYDNDDGGNFVSYGITLASTNLDNVWGLYSLVGTNGNSQKLYLNDGTTNATVNYSATGEKQDAWGSTDDGTQPFGYVSSMVVYNNQAFTQAQVAQYFNATKQYYGYAPNNTISYGLVMSLDAGQAISYPGNGTTWYDLSPFGNNGTLQNGPTFNSSNGGSIVFDGADDNVTIPYNPSLNTPTGCTYDLWVYPTNGGTVISRGTSDTGASPDNPRIYITPANGNIYYDWSSPGSDRYSYSTTNLTFNSWSNIVLVVIPNQPMKLYLNNVDVSGSPYGGNLPSPLPNTTDPIVMGTNWTSGYNGRIAAVQVYNRALSAAEIKQNFNAQKARFGL